MSINLLSNGLAREQQQTKPNRAVKFSFGQVLAVPHRGKMAQIPVCWEQWSDRVTATGPPSGSTPAKPLGAL